MLVLIGKRLLWSGGRQPSVKMAALLSSTKVGISSNEFQTVRVGGWLSFRTAGTGRTGKQCACSLQAVCRCWHPVAMAMARRPASSSSWSAISAYRFGGRKATCSHHREKRLVFGKIIVGARVHKILYACALHMPRANKLFSGTGLAVISAPMTFSSAVTLT